MLSKLIPEVCSRSGERSSISVTTSKGSTLDKVGEQSVGSESKG